MALQTCCQYQRNTLLPFTFILFSKKTLLLHIPYNILKAKLRTTRGQCFFNHQDSIGNTFGRYTSHPYKPIGETLDDIISGSVTSLPDISVTMINGLWYTADNRRLWVLQQAEQCGEIDDIYVSLTDEIDPNKLTTENHGISVKSQGRPRRSVVEKNS